MTANLQAALSYTQLGWSLLPIWWSNPDGSCGCGQQHYDNPKNRAKHPITEDGFTPRGLLDSSSDPAVVTSWFERYPQANVAVNCRASGLVVIDVDPRNDGEASWYTFESEVDVPQTLKAKTGGGGFHLFYRDRQLTAEGKRPRGKLAKGVDIKWDGYVLLAPSNHTSGGSYSWETSGQAPVDLGPLLERISQAGLTDQPITGGDASAVDLDALLEGVGEGSRHDAFKAFVARLRSRRMTFVEARLMIEAAWVRVEQSGDSPFPLSEALALLDWAWNLPPGTTAERELEAYANYIATLQANAAGAGRDANPYDSGGNDGDPVRGNQTGQDATLSPSSGSYNPAQLSTLHSRILSLPEALRMPVLEEIKRYDVRTTASQLINAVKFSQPRGDRLDHLLLNGVPEPEWTIEGLHERGTNMSLTAQFKTGKTTLQLNMLKSLADQVPFLGQFEVRPLQGNVAFFNYELTEAQFVRWAGRLRIAHPEKIWVLNMRGLRLDLGDDYTREWVTDYLRRRDVEFWFIDPLARAYYGNENDNTELKQWTDHVDQIKYDAGVVDCQVSLHTGRGDQEEGAERARGATRIDDWVDGRMILTRDAQSGHRFFRADGREVDVPETMLVFDAENHRLEVSNLAAGQPVTRHDVQRLQHDMWVVAAMQSAGALSIQTSISKNAIAQELMNRHRMGRHPAYDAINEAVRSGTITAVINGRTTTWYLATVVTSTMSTPSANGHTVESTGDVESTVAGESAVSDDSLAHLISTWETLMGGENGRES